MAALNFPFLLLLLSTTTLFLHTIAAPAPTSSSPSASGGYAPIPVDHRVEDLAKFAIDEHNKQAHDHLVYSKTLKAERQVVSGYNYRLVISALRDGVANNYQAVVYVPLGSSPKPQLTSFKRLLQTATLTTPATSTSTVSPPLIGGYKPIPIDHHVEELAKFAIDEHNRQAHDHLVYSKTLRAERQLVNGNNYRLAISALRDKVANNYQAVVYVPFGPHAKSKLTAFNPLIQTAFATTSATASPPPLGGYTPIPVDHHVEELAKFAIDEHNRQASA